MDDLDFYEGVFYRTEGMEQAAFVLEFGPCERCGYEWQQTYIPGATDV